VRLCVWAFESDAQSQAAGMPAGQALQGIEVISDVKAAVRQNVDGRDFKGHFQALQEFPVPARTSAKHVLVHKYFAAGKVDFPNTETRGILEMRRQFGEGDLLQPIVSGG
jgi:hypothetical protein